MPHKTANTKLSWAKPLRAAALVAFCLGTDSANAQWMITDLGDLPGGSDFTRAIDINNSGQVVGYSSAATGERGFLWQNGTMTNLGDLPGGINHRVATGINYAGQVVGTSGAATGNRGFLWENGTMTNLGDLPGGDDASFATGINNAGQVVGYSGAATGTRGFLWENGTMTDLGFLPGFGDFSIAYGINNAGQVVGGSGAANAGIPFLWQNGTMTDLNTFAGVVGTGWTLTQARAINDLGQIVGSGINPQGASRAFLLAPVPEPETYGMLLAGLGVMGFMARRRKNTQA